ncbi:MAG: L-histidine N(alpha)-methyltransferase [Pseudomonadales bacterium]|nr:L-histidine N(alpha)-methyltransferase [Pseudomonadales bacterium]
MSELQSNAALPLVEHRATPAQEFLLDVIEGFSQPQKTLPCKYFYDERGSKLFAAICETEEYYITRTELAILAQALPEIARRVGPACDIVEFGSGAGIKIRLLLEGLHQPRCYIPLDISSEILEQSAAELAGQFPGVQVVPVVGDYHKPIILPEEFRQGSHHRKLVFFPGSTISNFTPEEALGFLSRIRDILNPGDGFLIGVDCVKPATILNAAYNDAAGVTAAFNLNLLERIASTFHTNLRPQHFFHHAFFNAEQSRIEMHLVSRRDQVVEIEGHRFGFRQGETIHTENSYKYSLEDFNRLALATGFTTDQVWQDPERLFSLHYLTAC